MGLTRRVLAGLFASILVMAATAAAAQEQDEEAIPPGFDFARTGTYVSVGGGAAINVFRDTLVDVDDSWAINGRIGYRVARHWALEVEFEYAHEFQWDSGAYNSFYVPGLNLKYYFLEDRLQPYVLGGVNFAWSDVKNSTLGSFAGRQADWMFRFGLGLNMFATEHVAFYVEGSYLWGVGDLWELDYIPIVAGIEYHF